MFKTVLSSVLHNSTTMPTCVLCEKLPCVWRGRDLFTVVCHHDVIMRARQRARRSWWHHLISKKNLFKNDSQYMFCFFRPQLSWQNRNWCQKPSNATPHGTCETEPGAKPWSMPTMFTVCVLLSLFSTSLPHIFRGISLAWWQRCDKLLLYQNRSIWPFMHQQKNNKPSAVLILLYDKYSIIHVLTSTKTFHYYVNVIAVFAMLFS